LSEQHGDDVLDAHSGQPLAELGDAHGCLQIPLAQCDDMQSSSVRHLALRAHGSQLPPQSMSVSLPFFVRSPHVEARHVPSVHAPSVQSEPTWQRMPTAHGGHVAPPQSMSVSVESCTPLVHDAVAQTLFTQAALRQSAP
jgi:hypothetical protein